MLLRYFVKFLKEEKAYKSYRKYLSQQPEHNRIKTLFDKRKIKDRYISEIDSLLLGAFTWSYTEEGLSYWSKIHLKWIKKYDEEISKILKRRKSI